MTKPETRAPESRRPFALFPSPDTPSAPSVIWTNSLMKGLRRYVILHTPPSKRLQLTARRIRRSI